MKTSYIVIWLGAISLATLTVPACAPVIGGAALGVAGTVAIYNRQTIEQRLQDNDINSEILKQLKTDSQLTSQCHIEVTTYNKIVLMVGQSPTQTLKEKAEALVHQIPNIKKVYNAISIETPTTTLTRTNDTWITTKIKSQLLATKGLKSSPIKVLTEDGTVFLMGQVTHAQANLAVQSIKQIKGVEKVVKIFEYQN
jgi:osmotically-inducible protein OsmY